MDKYVCLMYHNISDQGDKYALHRADFLKQLNTIRDYGVTGRSIHEINLAENRKNSVSITFDDGFISDLWAAEKLSEFGFTGTFFLVEEFIKTRTQTYMDKSQVKAIAEMGHSIGVHGKNHKWWTTKPEGVLLKELTDTKKWLQDLTSCDVVSCSAPGGKLNKKIVREIRNSQDFKYIRNSFPWLNSFDVSKVNSMAILKEDSDAVFLKKMTGNRQYYRYSFAKQNIKDALKQVLGR